MGSWRKMGAFLGLVPEEEPHEDSFDEPDAYRSEYSGYRAEGSAPTRCRSCFSGGPRAVAKLRRTGHPGCSCRAAQARDLLDGRIGLRRSAADRQAHRVR